MAHTHEFDCSVCGAHLDSKQELDQHNEQHLPQGSQEGYEASGGSGSQSSRSRQASSGSRRTSGMS